jgi:hypothetical protein
MFLIEIAAWGRTPPDWSVTVPESVAPTTWACTVAGSKGLDTRAANARKHAAVLVVRIIENMAPPESITVFVPGAYDLKSDGKGLPPEQRDFQAFAYWTS